MFPSFVILIILFRFAEDADDRQQQDGANDRGQQAGQVKP